MDGDQHTGTICDIVVEYAWCFGEELRGMRLHCQPHSRVPTSASESFCLSAANHIVIEGRERAGQRRHPHARQSNSLSNATSSSSGQGVGWTPCIKTSCTVAAVSRPRAKTWSSQAAMLGWITPNRTQYAPVILLAPATYSSSSSEIQELPGHPRWMCDIGSGPGTHGQKEGRRHRHRQPEDVE